MTCNECGLLMVKTETGGGRCVNCGHATDEPFVDAPLQIWECGSAGGMILEDELVKAHARIKELEAEVESFVKMRDASDVWKRALKELLKRALKEFLK